MNKRLQISLLSIILVFGLNLSAFSQHTDTGSKKEGTHKFNAGEFIIDHVGDSYEWHIAGSHEHPISIPLPVILYSETSGFHFFMSSALQHGHKHEGFYIAGKESKFKGKIVKVAGSEEVRPYDISITKNTLTLFLSLIVIVWLFTSIAKTYTKRKGKAPKGIQSLMEPLILFIRDDIAKASISGDQYKKFTPYLLTIFFFIFLNNLLGLIPLFPGGANLTGNIAITMVMAVFTFLITTVNGNKHYWKHIFWGDGIPWWLNITIMPIVEILGLFIKPFVLMVRLFANITAGHIVALGFFSLIFIFGEMAPAAGFGVSVLSVTFTVFMTVLELLVAFIQAYVFTLLSALYFGMATEQHHKG